MGKSLRRRRSGGDQFAKRLERAATAGTENGAAQAVYWLAGAAAFATILWLVKQFRNA